MDLKRIHATFRVELDEQTAIDSTEAIKIQGGTKSQFMQKLIKFDEQLLDTLMKLTT